MADKMLIDATHPEETRVVVLRGNRVEEFDFESANRKQLRGNIYLAKVTRVEPSLQAAFVDYGGNRHGFLAFSEIHPDYYQIPVADRQALLDEEQRAQKDADDDADHRAGGRRGGRNRHRHRGADRQRSRDVLQSAPVAGEEQPTQEFTGEVSEHPAAEAVPGQETAAQIAETAAAMPTYEPLSPEPEAPEQAGEVAEISGGEAATEPAPMPEGEAHGETGEHADAEAAPSGEPGAQGNGNGDDHHEEEAVESVGGADALEEARMPRFRRQYKIQEVIKRRQVMLVQVVKEERGTKGAALTTYLSLAGRYSVLMPNTARGGGISRKITSGEDRSRLKEIAGELEVPQGMGVILRTAGASRTKTEVKRDFEYLLRLWETVRDLTLKSMAPKLVYEEGSLTKRSIRDLYTKDIDEIIVSGDEGYREAREFMRMLMPSHAKHVKLYNDAQPLFTRYGIESQLDAMFSPTVQLRSGGYIVINQAEALVAIDVNSGRATREHHIEDTALKTNGEAAEEIARQLRLRDLAGLIVIDFIDMDEGRNNRTVERRLKDALKHDRARIQVGHISHFGLLEMSRQRIRTSVLESSTEKCPVCGGSGHVRSVSSVALQCLRAIEEMLNKGATHNLIVRTRSEVALYVLNHKRAHLRALEERFRITITISADASVNAQVSYIVDRGEQVHTAEAAKAIAEAAPQMPVSALEADEDVLDGEVEAEIDEEAEDETPSHAASETPDLVQAEPLSEAPRGDGERDGGRSKRRRRGRGRGRGGEERGPRESGQPFARDAAPEQLDVQEDHGDGSSAQEAEGASQQPPRQGGAPGAEGDVRRRRRRGRRGGRRNRQGRNGEAPLHSNGGEAEPGLQHAVEDMDRPPAFEPARSYSPPPDERPTPQAAAPAPTEQEPPRRRSTIREPAPFSGASAAPAPSVPPPTPVISSTASEDGSQPKRGWWAKKLLGDK
ncbi:MAG TPA: Rne/Rng family ribonuclease [Pseudolabrys sp.]|nr:Rne/Rng family ribonuclease [Pseudolabrys sp.]